MGSKKILTNELHCHFNWNIRSIVGDKEVVDKLKEKDEEIAGQQWRNLLIILTTAYELYMKNDSGANEKLQEAITIWGNSDDEFTLKYNDAFRHVIYSVKLFFVKDISSQNVIEQIYDYIPPYSTLPTQQKVAITAIKAHVFSEYGPNGTRYALELAKEALKNNPNEAEWSFLVGKMLSRIRQFSFDYFVTEEEVDCLRRAYTLSKSPAHAVFLAQTYCTISKALFGKLPLIKGRRILNNEEGRIIKSYNEKAHVLFKEALIGNNDKCTHINFRCARGLFNLPGEFKDLPKALSLVEASLERAPTNVYGNTVAGNIYYAIGEYDKAFKHLSAAEEGGSFGASIKKFQIAFEQCLKVNPEKEYDEIMKKHPEIMYKLQTCLHAISFFIFKKRDIYKALKYFFIAVELNATLEDYYCFVYWIKETTDLCFIVYNEVKRALEDPKSKTGNRMFILRNAINIINEKYTKVSKRKLNPSLVEFLIKRAPKYSKKKFQIKPYNNNNRKILIEQSERKDNFKPKRTNSKKNFGRRSKERKRTDSVCSNASVSSVSSVASNGSFKKIRRNSREACLLDIVHKDLERENHCKNFTEIKNTQDTCLTPHYSTNVTLAGSNERKPLSMGCTGWSKKSNENLSYTRKNSSSDRSNYQMMKSQQRDGLRPSRSPSLNSDVSQLNDLFRNMRFNSEGPKQNRSPSFSGNNFKSGSGMQRASSVGEGGRGRNTNNSEIKLGSFVSDTGGRSYRSSLENVNRGNQYVPKSNSGRGSPINQSRDSYRSSLENVNRGNQYVPTSNSGRGSPINQSKGSYRSSLESVNRGNQYVPTSNSGRGSPLNQSKSSYMSQSPNNYGGKPTDHNKLQGLVRKPFNLSRTDSLDSDDSARSERSRRLSTSSVDSDYVRDSSVPYFPWHRKYTGKK